MAAPAGFEGYLSWRRGTLENEIKEPDIKRLQHAFEDGVTDRDLRAATGAFEITRMPYKREGSLTACDRNLYPLPISCHKLLEPTHLSKGDSYVEGFSCGCV